MLTAHDPLAAVIARAREAAVRAAARPGESRLAAVPVAPSLPPPPPPAPAVVPAHTRSPEQRERLDRYVLAAIAEGPRDLAGVAARVSAPVSRVVFACARLIAAGKAHLKGKEYRLGPAPQPAARQQQRDLPLGQVETDRSEGT